MATAVDQAVPPVSADPLSVPPAAVQGLQQGMRLPQSAGSTGLRYDQNPKILQKELDGPNGLRAQKKFLENRIHNPASSQITIDRAEMNLKILDEMIAAKEAGKPLEVFRQEKQAEQAKIAAAERAANAPQGAPAAAATAPGGAPDNAPPQTPEQLLAGAEDSFENEARASADELAVARKDMINATQEQLARMGKVVENPSGVDTKNRELISKLVKELMSSGKNPDDLIEEKNDTFKNNEGKDLIGRITDARNEKNGAIGRVAELRGQLATEKKEPGNDDAVRDLEAALKEAEKIQKETEMKYATLTQKLEDAKKTVKSEVEMLSAMKEHADKVASLADDQIQSTAAVLKGSTNPDNKLLGEQLETVSISVDDSLKMTVTPPADPNVKIALAARLGGSKILESPPRLLAAVEDARKKEQTV
ncbi:MAG: hypothetical protein PHZ00_01585 [Candidatus Peribacteraceae bacterium]|nr:hypothetical protein [Candidatus Peribacteraceae bacterium]